MQQTLKINSLFTLISFPNLNHHSTSDSKNKRKYIYPHPLFLISAHTPFPLPQAPLIYVLSLKVPSLRYLPIMLPLCERGGNHWNEANHLLAGMI